MFVLLLSPFSGEEPGNEAMIYFHNCKVNSGSGLYEGLDCSTLKDITLVT